MFLETEINHIKVFCDNNDVNKIVTPSFIDNLNKQTAQRFAQSIILSPNLNQNSMELLLSVCESKGIYISPQIKSIAISRNENLSLEFLLNQDKENILHSLINPNVPGEVVIKRAKEKGRSHYFLLKNKNVTRENSLGLIDNDFNAALYHASGFGITQEQYISYMEGLFKLKENPSSKIQQTSMTILLSSPHLKGYLNYSELSLAELILKLEGTPSSKAISHIITGDSIKSEDIIPIITDERIMRNSSEAIKFALDTFRSSRYHLNKTQAKECLDSFTRNISSISPKDIGNIFGLHTYLILLNLDYGSYNESEFYEWARQLDNNTSLNQLVFTPENLDGLITSSGDSYTTLIDAIDSINPKNNFIDIILKFSEKNYPIFSNNLTSVTLNRKINSDNIITNPNNRKSMHFL